MNFVKVKSWAMIILAAVVLGIAVSQCITQWKPCCGKGWLMWTIDLLCAIISIAYIAKYAFILKQSKQE